MSLRLRIFLLIGLLFVFVFASTQVIERYIVRKYLTISRNRIMQDIHDENNVKQKVLQNYLMDIIDYIEAEMDVLLGRILIEPALIKKYGPTKKNFVQQNWLSSAMLISSNKQFDFVQITNEKKLTAAILLTEGMQKIARQVPYGGPVPLFIMESALLNEDVGPYVGIPFEFQQTDHTTGQVDYLLFDISTVMALDLQEIASRMALPQNKAMKDAFNRILPFIREAQEFFHSRPEFYHQITSSNKMNWLLKTMPNLKTLNTIDLQEVGSSIFSKINRRYHEIKMIDQYGIFMASGIFGYSPFDKIAPVGIAHIFAKENRGQMLYKYDVYHDAPLSESLQPKIQYFFDQNFKRFFFGKTVEIATDKSNSAEEEKKRTGTVTLGVDATRILKNLALVSHRMSFFATKDKVIKGFDTNGADLAPYFSLIPLSTILSEKTGVVHAPDGKGFFFITLRPFPDADFYFFLLNPLSEEFALVDAIDKEAKDILQKIHYQTQVVIGAVLLLIIFIAHFLAKRITKPIQLLVKATSKVKEGRLNDIHLPPMHKGKMDEIESLYFSFSQMVAGLKEKEKVKGILDKVVSPTIAKEILQGHIHLGGEEKEVTVLFADIRRFSDLTENMLPTEVIQMLNQCMTKISHIIDRHGGVIDKYVGDEVMALFGAPVAQKESASQAVICALEIQHALENWNRERASQNLGPIQMGIGIHTGVVVAGNMGAENRLNYTVLGANVNLAARICSIAHEGEVIISGETLAQDFVKDNIQYEALDPIELKGFSHPVTLFRVKS